MTSRKEIIRHSSIQLLVVALLAACAPTKNHQSNGTKDLSTNLQITTLEEELKPSSKIVGGVAVASEESIATSTVALYNPVTGELCTATIVGKNLAVTAAHCASYQVENSILIFERHLPNSSSDMKPVYRKILKGKTHPDYNANSDGKNQGDIALLRFSGDLPAGYKPSLLLKNKAFLKPGMDVIIAGFGMLSMVPEVEATALMKAQIQISNPNYSESEVLFEQFEGRGACHGDSGGPAFVFANSQQILFGVTSRSATLNGGSTCLEGSIYTSVSFYLPWLKSVAAEILRD